MKKALTTRQKTVQMLLERWRQKQEETEAGTATLVSLQQSQPPPQSRPRRQSTAGQSAARPSAARQLKID